MLRLAQDRRANILFSYKHCKMVMEFIISGILLLLQMIDDQNSREKKLQYYRLGVKKIRKLVIIYSMPLNLL